MCEGGRGHGCAGRVLIQAVQSPLRIEGGPGGGFVLLERMGGARRIFGVALFLRGGLSFVVQG